MTELDRHPNKRAHAGNPEKCGVTTRKPGNDRYPGEPGRPCRQPAGAGTPHTSGACWLHGGRTPSGLVAASRRDAEKAAARELERLDLWGARRDISPVDALSEELERTAGRVAAIEQRLSQLPEEAQDTARARGLAAELAAERGQLQRVAEAAVRAGVPERRTEVAQDQALQVAALIRSVLGDLELSPAQQAAVPALMRWHWASLSGQAAGPRPPLPSQLAEGSYFDPAVAAEDFARSQSGVPEPERSDRTPEAPHDEAPPAQPDGAQLLELRAVVARRERREGNR